jgi:stage III sporulation protein AG
MNNPKGAGWRFLPAKPPWYLWLAVGALLLGCLLVSLSNMGTAGGQQPGQLPVDTISQLQTSKQQTELMATARELEEQLQGILEQIAGSGQVAVRVSLEASPLREYATNTRTTQHSVEERDQGGGSRITTDSSMDTELVMARNGQMNAEDNPVTIRESRPEVQGVVVVAQGANNPLVRARITRAVETLWGLAPHQVQVLPMELQGGQA